MNNLIAWGDKTVRTQITLTKKIKEEVERRARKNGESMSEYLRKAAIVRINEEEKHKKHIDDIAKKVIGSINLKNHPEWSSKEKVYKWVREIRRDKE